MHSGLVAIKPARWGPGCKVVQGLLTYLPSGCICGPGGHIMNRLWIELAEGMTLQQETGYCLRGLLTQASSDEHLLCAALSPSATDPLCLLVSQTPGVPPGHPAWPWTSAHSYLSFPICEVGEVAVVGSTASQP